MKKNNLLTLLALTTLWSQTALSQQGDCAATSIGGECHTLSLPRYYNHIDSDKPVEMGLYHINYHIYPSVSGLGKAPAIIRVSSKPISYDRIAADDLTALATIRKTHTVILYNQRNSNQLHAPHESYSDIQHLSLPFLQAKDTSLLIEELKQRSDIDSNKLVLFADSDVDPGAIIFAQTKNNEVPVVISEPTIINAQADGEFGDLSEDGPLPGVKSKTENESDSDTKDKGSDPLEGMNRIFFRFNMWLDEHAMKPLVKGYKYITPETIQKGLANFINNLTKPTTFINQILQLEPIEAIKTASRFVIDSTAGMAGFINVSEKVLGKQIREDFGQTLGVWGLGEGFYVVLPMIGPSGGRDFVGFVVDNFVFKPISYVPYLGTTPSSLARGLVQQIAEYQGDQIDFIRKSSVDFYAQVRRLYRKQRQIDIETKKTFIIQETVK